MSEPNLSTGSLGAGRVVGEPRLHRYGYAGRVFGWLFRRRFLRALLFLSVCVATLAALFYAEEDLRGKRAWNAYAREQTAKGEKLSLAGFIPPTVPDEQNLTLCPLLKPILDIEFRTVTQGKFTQ